MEADWGFGGANDFTKTVFSDVHPDINPDKTTLPDGFSVCVLGGSRGIGAGVATCYAKAGASVIVLAGRRTSGLEEVAQKCKAVAKRKDDIKVLVVQCDIIVPADVEALAAKTREACNGGLDVLALNSGVSDHLRKVHEVPTEQFIYTTAVNYTGTFLAAKFFIPLLLAKPRGAKMFAVVNAMASLIVRGPIANAPYCVSKAAQLRLAELIHEEYHADGAGLRVYCACPGAVATELALEKAPEAFKAALTDGAELCGAFFVWLTQRGDNVAWLSGRCLSAKWDVIELEKRRNEIVENEMLKLRLVLNRGQDVGLALPKHSIERASL